jgi:hypothetical protein
VLLDPLRIPEDAWSHGEVLAVLAVRDIGGLFRWISQLTGASQSRIGAAVGLEQGYVSRIMAGRKVTSIDVLGACQVFGSVSHSVVTEGGG